MNKTESIACRCMCHIDEEKSGGVRTCTICGIVNGKHCTPLKGDWKEEFGLFISKHVVYKEQENEIIERVQSLLQQDRQRIIAKLDTEKMICEINNPVLPSVPMYPKTREAAHKATCGRCNGIDKAIEIVKIV